MEITIFYGIRESLPGHTNRTNIPVVYKYLKLLIIRPEDAKKLEWEIVMLS